MTIRGHYWLAFLPHLRLLKARLCWLAKSYGNYGGLRTEEGFDELSSSLLRHYEPKEGIYLKMGGEKTKNFWEVRIRCRERIMEGRGSFQWELAYCHRIKWLATTLSVALIKKWPEQWNSQLSSPFYHLQQKFKGTSVIRRA